jgi:hypothetical protein
MQLFYFEIDAITEVFGPLILSAISPRIWHTTAIDTATAAK